MGLLFIRIFRELAEGLGRGWMNWLAFALQEQTIVTRSDKQFRLVAAPPRSVLGQQA